MNILKNWQPQKACAFRLDENVDIWKLNLIPEDAVYKKFRRILTHDELQRADRFHFEKDRQGFVAARGQLRLLLERYTGIKAHEIEFTYGKYGKPYLADVPIEFSISHSRKLGLVGFDAREEIGIDIERKRLDFGGLKIARRFFSKAEADQLENLPKACQLDGFFNGWSRKEAYIKARGKGLSIPLDMFSVSLTPGAKPQLLSTDHDPQAVNLYTLHEIISHPNYCSAVVAGKKRTQFNLFNFEN